MPKEEPSDNLRTEVRSALHPYSPYKHYMNSMARLTLSKLSKLFHDHLCACDPSDPGEDLGGWRYGDGEGWDEWIRDWKPGTPDVEAREKAGAELQSLYPELQTISEQLKEDIASCGALRLVTKSKLKAELRRVDLAYEKLHAWFNSDEKHAPPQTNSVSKPLDE